MDRTVAIPATLSYDIVTYHHVDPINGDYSLFAYRLEMGQDPVGAFRTISEAGEAAAAAILARLGVTVLARLAETVVK